MSDDTSQRLEAIQGELATILEARLAELNRTLRDTEAATRRIISAEVEIERHRGAQASLDGQLEHLQADLDEGRERARSLAQRERDLNTERERQRDEVLRLEDEVRGVEVEVERTRGRVTDLEAEAEALRSENQSLRVKLKTLEENILRMQKIKEELMSSISGLTAQMSTLAGGSPE